MDSVVTDGPHCDWPVAYTGCDDGECGAGWDTAMRATVEAMAVDWLRTWTAGRYGCCRVTVRPCGPDCAGERLATFWGRGPYPSQRAWGPVLVDGAWFNVGCGACPGPCGCRVPGLALPGPVHAVDEVWIDGHKFTDWRLAQGVLVRTDGDRWPTCQDMRAEPCAEGAFSVTYRRGVPVPVGGQVAAGLLACEIAKALCNDSSCRLPQRVQSVTRQGVTVAVLDDFDGAADGRTGLWLVDSWLKSVQHRPMPSRVVSPEVRR